MLLLHREEQAYYIRQKRDFSWVLKAVCLCFTHTEKIVGSQSKHTCQSTLLVTEDCKLEMLLLANNGYYLQSTLALSPLLPILLAHLLNKDKIFGLQHNNDCF